MKTIFTLLISSLLLVSCAETTKTNNTISVSPENLHASIEKVTEIMIHDIFSPPVASRIYAYPNIAAYEIISLKDSLYTSLAGQVTGLTSIPKPETTKTINYEVAAMVAHMELSKKLIFSEDRMEVLQDSLYHVWGSSNEVLFNNSKEYGLLVSDHISEWMSKDNYKQTRTMPQFSVDTDEPGRWQPTPPAYMQGIEPHWNKIRPFVIDSASQFKPIPPPAFSMEKNSLFYKELFEVYSIRNDITTKGDSSEEIKIAQFWDCNPYVSVTRGHLMFATKKITPGGHWMGITKIACKNTKSDFNKSLYAYTKASIAMVDAFISCWDEKYRSNLIRPETLINEHIDPNWKPILQTPPFPEYTSGHSVVSGAASIALTDIFGENFSFDDDTEIPYGLPIRSFTSFKQAADEAAISRMYGGIHYRAAVEVGVQQGRNLGAFVVDNLNMIGE